MQVSIRISSEERRLLQPSGYAPVLDNRVGWAKTYLKKAGLLDSPRRGYVKISALGSSVLARAPDKIDIAFLEQFPAFVEFRYTRKETEEQRDTVAPSNKTPEELIETGYLQIKASLVQDLLERLRNCSPSFFERVVLDLLKKLGYGAGVVTGHSGDGGIDGELNQDSLGLDKVVFQAKRYSETTPVSASQIRDFVGSLSIKGVKKGIFVTTSKFPSDAEETVKRHQIVLINGIELAKLMIDSNLGVYPEGQYAIQKIDLDYFSEE